jgi:hypothetical protein
VFDEFPTSRPNRRQVLQARLTRLCGQAKDLLGRIGLPVRKTIEEIAFTGRGMSHNAWTWTEGEDGTLEQFTDEQVIGWLHEEIMRAPNPRGVDPCIVGIALGYDEAEGPTATRSWSCDKWGWRKKGEAHVRDWILHELTQLAGKPDRLAVRADVYSFGRMMVDKGDDVWARDGEPFLEPIGGE